MNLALQRVFVFVLLALLRCGASEGDSNLCAYRDVRLNPSPGGPPSSSSSSKSTSSSSEEMFRNWGGEVQDDNLTIRCHSNIYCFTLWASDARNKSKAKVLKQGCWIGEANVCKQGSCVSSMVPKNNSHFCCCSGDMCNLNFTDGYDPDAHTTTTPIIPSRPIHDRNYKIKTVIISLVSVFSVALVITVAYFGYRMCTRPKHPSIESLHAPESPPVQPEFDMDDLKLGTIISKGRYAEVWKGKLEDRDVAVKIYSPHYREYYNNERTLYRLPFMDHEGLVRFYGADERITQEGSAQLMIVMSYIPLGSLNGYLKNNTLDWATMAGMAYSVAKALSHMHTDIQKADQFKPVLAHRDLNTRNILVRPDLTCVLSDFGFAIATMGSKLIKKGHAEVAEQTSLTDVGTLRYMAPELLDGAVNLRDCEASLKQIDIYALGLVLWEIAMRCVDLYQGAPVPEYSPPFQAEIGCSPSFEDMQLTVVRAKKRPRFPEVWKETNQAVRSLKETIEECWDADAEARLTALCVEERLSDLPNLWAHEIKHRGMTPTLNAMINITETTTTTTDHTTTSTSLSTTTFTTPSQPPPPTTMTEAAPAHLTHENEHYSSTTTTAPLLGNSNHNGHSHDHSDFSRSPSVSLTRSWLQDASMSTGTMDTVLATPPPAESSGIISSNGIISGSGSGSGSSCAPVPPPVKASNLLQERNSTVRRPHTGRNPTVERNTHKRSDEELRVSGNRLVSSAFPEPAQHPPPPPPFPPGAESPPDYISDGPETSLVQNDALSHRNPNPIPYVQNQVHGSSGNGNSNSNYNTNHHHNHNLLPAGRPKVANTNNSARNYARGGERSLREKLSRLIRPKELGLKLSSFSFFFGGGGGGGGRGGGGGGGGGRRRHHDYSRADDMEVEDLNQVNVDAGVGGGGGGGQLASSRGQGHGQGQGQAASPHSNLQPVNTEVRMHNGAAVTRPTNLTLSANPSLRETPPSHRRLNQDLSVAAASAEEEENEEAGRREANLADVAREGWSFAGAATSRSQPGSGSWGHERSSREAVGTSSSSSSSSAAKDGHSGSAGEVSARAATDEAPKPAQPARSYPENRLRFAEVGVAKLRLPPGGQQPVRRAGQGHRSWSTSSELPHLHHHPQPQPKTGHWDSSCWQETELSSRGGGGGGGGGGGEELTQRKRPTSLSLKGHNYSSLASKPLLAKRSASKPDMVAGAGSSKASTKPKHDPADPDPAPDPSPPKRSQSVGHRSGRAASMEEVTGRARPDGGVVVEASEKIRRRVKTPVRPSKKSGRLSLYDDRLMTRGGESTAEQQQQRQQRGDGSDLALKKSSTSCRLAGGSDGGGSGGVMMRRGGQRGNGSVAVVHDGHPSQHSQGTSAMSISDSNIVV